MALDLQAAVNATAAGATLNLTANADYGPAKVSRKIIINGNAARITGTGNALEFAPGSNGSTLRNVTVQGPTAANAACILVRAPDITIEDVTAQDSLQYGIRQYQTDRLTLRRVHVTRVATGIQVHRNGADNLFEDVACIQIDRMRVDDGSLGTNGGQGLDFYFTTGTTRVNRLTVIGARAKTKGGVSWTYDGSAVEGYGACAPVIIDGFDFRDCVNVCEVGTNPNTGVPTGWVFRNGEAHGNPDPAPGWDRNCQGFFLRANNSFIIEDSVFENLDDFVLNLTSGGSYGGVMGNNTFRNNLITPKPGPSGTSYGLNRAYIVSGGVTPTAWGDVSGNTVLFDAAKNPEIGYRSGLGPAKDVNTWRNLTNWSLTNEVWGPAKSPLDEANATIARLNAELAACQAGLTTVTANQTELRQQVDDLEATLAQINALSET